MWQPTGSDVLQLAFSKAFFMAIDSIVNSSLSYCLSVFVQLFVAIRLSSITVLESENLIDPRRESVLEHAPKE